MKTKKSNSVLYESELMKRILEVRYTDMEEEKRLCKLLLDISEPEQYLYGCAFANVYLMDSHLALGEYSSCDFYLLRASFLCREQKYDRLMLVLCNCAGLYYQKLNDDQTALSYLLEGKKLAEKLGDIRMVSILYNNIGFSFGTREDWASAREYFQLAYQTIEPHLEENVGDCVGYLSNVAEACKYLGDASGSRQALERCETLHEDSAYSRIRLGCSWSSYYAMIHDFKRCAEEADKMMESGLRTLEDKFFVCDMAEGLCNNMLNIGDQKRAEQLLEILQSVEYQTSLYLQYHIICLEIRYWEQFGGTNELIQAYQKYYEIVEDITVIEDDTRAQSMRSKIQINQTTQEHEKMLRQNKELENASQLDDLTELYNRRYFNKLVTKMTHKKDTKFLGFIMLDVDYFKQYNDFYGHFKGDDALRMLAKVLSDNARKGIYVSRYGGDEFVCLCVDLTDQEVEAYTERVITGLKNKEIPHEMNQGSSILTISVGYCNEPFYVGIDSEELLNLSDQALYEVKKNGRNGCGRKRLER